MIGIYYKVGGMVVCQDLVDSNRTYRAGSVMLSFDGYSPDTVTETELWCAWV